jgi:hypothetical protein
LQFLICRVLCQTTTDGRVLFYIVYSWHGMACREQYVVYCGCPKRRRL